MNKENESGGLSKEQRARITNNFRAAKALLARKRPRHQFTDAKNIEGSSMVNSIERFPLSEISMNAPSPATVKGLKLVTGDSDNILCSRKINHSFRTRVETVVESEAVAKLFVTPTREFDSCSTLCSEVLSIDRSNGDSLSERRQRVEPIKFPGLNNLDSFITPERQLHFPASSKSSSVSTIFDEDFDDMVLEEIDALCEAKSEVPSESEGLSANFPTEILSVKDKCLERKNDLTTVFPRLLEAVGTLNSTDLKKCEEANATSSEAQDYGTMPEEYVKYMKSLNDRQRKAACCDISTPLIIVAGPGSGKTSTMVGRVLMLLNEGIDPSNILAMTFTTAAASEMRERIGKVAGKTTAKQLTVSTFHSFCLQLCRLYAEKIGRTPEFMIYGHGQQRRAIIEAVRLLDNGKSRKNLEIQDAQKLKEELQGINSLQYFKDKAKKWQKFVAQAKASGRNPEDCRRTGDTIGAAILQNYDDILKTCNALDYHDFISSSLKLLSDFPEVFKESQESWKAIVIDEFQDTSAMQYGLLRILASHKRITVVGDEDQSIFSFNGADVSGFDSFRKDFPDHKEVRLNKNYRSTRCIVEAASCLIKNNLKRCQLNDVLTDNSSGSKITVKECSNEDAQCAFVVDKILETASDATSAKSKFGSIAVLYRRQVTGKMFQTAFRNRKIPFNIHGVAFYRKKVVRAIISMLRTTCPVCDDGSFRRVFKALLPFDKEEKKKVIDHIDKILTVRKCSFITAARDIFGAKISGTFKRNQLTQGRKVLSTIGMIFKLVQREDSISAVITSVANMIPQKYLLEQRAVIDVDGGKYLNEDNDMRPVLQYLLDDVSAFLSTQFNVREEEKDPVVEDKGCGFVLKAFIDYISERETENFRSRRHDNEEGVTLTTIHQSKGLEWDNVFIVKANESEIPLLHEFNGVAKENCNSIEEERRLLYVAMTRARKKLFILYVLMDPNWQMLQPSRFLKEIPVYLRENQDAMNSKVSQRKDNNVRIGGSDSTADPSAESKYPKADTKPHDSVNLQLPEASRDSSDTAETCNGSSFLKRFNMEDRAVISHLFHQWAKKPAFKDPKRLIDKVGFAVDERLRVKKSTHKDAMRSLKSCLKCDEAFEYALYVLRWEQIPADQRAHIMREKQEHFQKLRIENAMSSSEPTSKQIAYLQSLGCTVIPSSRLHASHLIEEYKKL